MEQLETKTCTKCKIPFRPPFLDYFRPAKKGKNGLSSICKECERAYARNTHTGETKIRRNEQCKKWRHNNLEYDKKRRRDYYANNKEKELLAIYKARIKTQYNLSYENYLLMIETQNKKCKVCKQDFSKIKYKPNIDHCHKTGKVRGLLCKNCNIALGMVNDDINILIMLIDYLINDGNI